MANMRFVPRVKSSALNGFQPVCSSLGLNSSDMLAIAGLSNVVLRSPELKIGYDKLALIINHSANVADFPLFGLTLARYQKLSTFGPLGLLALQSGTVEQSIQVIQKYFYLYANGVTISLARFDGNCVLSLKVLTAANICNRQIMERNLMIAYNVLCELAPEFKQETFLHFRHAPLTSTSEYSEIASVEFLFNRQYDALTFPARLLTLKPRLAPQELENYLKCLIQQEPVGYEEILSRRVSNLIQELIPTGEAKLGLIASILGMHERTLQKSLRQTGTDFRALLDEVRYQNACIALTQNCAITDIALNLGYSEPSAFSRAFKRWSNLSPQQWREQYLPAPTATA